MSVKKTVCIIGAGSSGITAAKTLKEYKISFDCFEKVLKLEVTGGLITTTECRQRIGLCTSILTE